MKISKINRIPHSGKVYNFHCAPDENYFANSLLVHNCYKKNSGDQPTHNLSFNDFVKILHRMPPVLTQIAFGILNISTNKDFFPMMTYARMNGVIPNYTTHGLDVNKEIAEKTARLCGAVAVSIVNKEKTYDAIKMYTDAGMTQVNIHYMLSEETFDRAFTIMGDMKSDPRLAKMNAIVFLQYKSKGREPNKFHSIKSVENYRKLMAYAQENGISIGFDSCSAPLFMKAMEGTAKFDQVIQYAEPCESGLFSSYISHTGSFYPCSFLEGGTQWDEGLDVLNCRNFLTDIWYHPRVIGWRNTLIASSIGCKSCKLKDMCRSCPEYDVSACKGEKHENS